MSLNPFIWELDLKNILFFWKCPKINEQVKSKSVGQKIFENVRFELISSQTPATEHRKPQKANLVLRETLWLEIVGTLKNETDEEYEYIALHQVGDAGKLFRKCRERWRRMAFGFRSCASAQALCLFGLWLALFGVVIEEDVVLREEFRS